MKKIFLALLMVFVSSIAFAENYDFKGHGNYGTSPQERYKIDSAVHNERVRNSNSIGIGPLPSYGSSNESYIEGRRRADRLNGR